MSNIRISLDINTEATPKQQLNKELNQFTNDFNAGLIDIDLEGYKEMHRLFVQAAAVAARNWSEVGQGKE